MGAHYRDYVQIAGFQLVVMVIITFFATLSGLICLLF